MWKLLSSLATGGFSRRTWLDGVLLLKIHFRVFPLELENLLEKTQSYVVSCLCFRPKNI